jgi:hypothetical protein
VDLRPGADSTPLRHVDAQGRTLRIAAATLSAVSPPASTIRVRVAARLASSQSAMRPVPLSLPSNSSVSGRSSGSGSCSRQTGSSRCGAVTGSDAASPWSICSQSGAKTARTSSTSIRVGCFITATHSAPTPRRLRELRGLLRRDAPHRGANTKPSASAPASSAGRHRHRRRSARRS